MTYQNISNSALGFHYPSVGYNESSSSLYYSRPPTLYTTTSSSTVPGIGSLSGKGILAFGRLILRGVEWMIIPQKLRAARSLFPHTDHATFEGIEQAYDDLLELTRPDLYSSLFRKQAMNLLMTQIEQRNVLHLTNALVKWPHGEISLFLTGVMSYMVKASPGNYENEDLDLPVEDVLQHLALLTLDRRPQYSDHNPALPFVHLIIVLAEACESSCKAIVDTRALDVLLLWYLMEFTHRSVPTLHAQNLRRHCQHVLLTLSRSHISQFFSSHPLLRLMPESDLEPPPDYFMTRREIWRTFKRDDPILRWRLAGISSCIQTSRTRLLVDATTQLNTLIAFGDLLEFVTSEYFEFSMTNKALQIFFEWISLEREVMLMIRVAYIGRQFDGTAGVLSCLFELVQRAVLDTDGKHTCTDGLVDFFSNSDHVWSPHSYYSLGAGIGVAGIPLVSDFLVKALGQDLPIFASSLPGLSSTQGTFAALGSQSFGKLGTTQMDIPHKLGLIFTFPHKDDITVGGLQEVYDVVLEFTRPEMQVTLKREAMKLLIQQVAQLTVSNLVKSLAKWPCEKISLFLIGVANYMANDMMDNFPNFPLLLGDYSAHHHLALLGLRLPDPPLKFHSGIPFMHLIVQIAQSGKSGCQAIIKSGVLDILLVWYLMDFTYNTNCPQSDHLHSNIRKACQSAFQALGAPSIASLFASHPLHGLMLQENVEPMTYYHFGERWELWNTLSKDDPIFHWRLASISHLIQTKLLSPEDKESARLEALVALGDLLQFSISGFLAPSVVNMASQLLAYMVISESGVLSMTPYLNGQCGDTVKIFSQLLEQVWTQLVDLNVDGGHTFANALALQPPAQAAQAQPTNTTTSLHINSRGSPLQLESSHWNQALHGVNQMDMLSTFTPIFIFPHDSEDVITARRLEDIYGIVLEFTRSEMQLSLRTQAIKLLNQQVMQLTISHLVKSLMKWPFEMISAFLTEMANYMAEDLMNDFPQFPLLLREYGKHHHLAVLGLHIPDPSVKPHPGIPFLHLIDQIAQSSKSGCQAIMKSGVLDILLVWYLMDFTCDTNGAESEHIRSNIRKACHSTFQALGTPSIAPLFSSHLLHKLMLQESAEPATDYHFRRRRELWRAFHGDDPIFCWRLAEISRWIRIELLRPSIDNPKHLGGLIALCDLLEFSTSEFLQSAVSTDALEQLLSKFTNSIKAFGFLRVNVHTNLQKNIALIVAYLERESDNTTELLPCLVNRMKNLPHGMRPRVVQFVHFLSEAAEASRSIHEALVETGIFSLLPPVLVDCGPTTPIPSSPRLHAIPAHTLLSPTTQGETKLSVGKWNLEVRGLPDVHAQESSQSHKVEPAPAYNQPSPFLQHQHLTPIFSPPTDPPPYRTFARHPHSPMHIIQPRDEEGLEQLPRYANDIYLAAIMLRKLEFVMPGVQAKNRKWRRVLCVLDGTVFKVYKYPLGAAGVGLIGEWWEKMVGVGGIQTQTSYSHRVEAELAPEKLESELSAPEMRVLGADYQPVESSPSARPLMTSSNRPSPASTRPMSTSSSQSKLTGNPEIAFLGPSLTNHSQSPSQSDVPKGRGSPSRWSTAVQNRHTGLKNSISIPSPPSNLNATVSMGPTAIASPALSTGPSLRPSNFIATLSTSGEVPLPKPEDLIRVYSLQHAEYGLGSDYIKRKNVIRLRMEGEQFLLQVQDIAAVGTWIEAFQTASNIALDLDERVMPKAPWSQDAGDAEM